jgi:hypothetical protein
MWATTNYQEASRIFLEEFSTGMLALMALLRDTLVIALKRADEAVSQTANA